MDPRFEAIAADQLGSGLPDLSGSEARATIRLSDRLVNQIVAAALPRDGAVRALTLHARAGNTVELGIALARPAFLPELHAQLTIERQPALPDAAILVLRVSGGAGGLLKMAGPFLSKSLPPSVRLEHDLVLVDLRALLAAHGQSSHLRYARELRVTTEEATLVVHVVAAV